MTTKTQGRRRNATSRRTWERRYARTATMERLEDRHLLSAANLFSQFTGLLDPARDNAVEQIAVTIAPEQLGMGQDRVVLGFRLQASEGSSLDPAAVDIFHENGSRVSPLYARPNLPGTTASYVLADLRGGNYRVDVTGQTAGRSQFRLDVLLIGDVDGDHVVDRNDLYAIRQMAGARAGDGVYVASADADLDGRITPFDESMARRNEAYSRGGARTAGGLYSLMAMACGEPEQPAETSGPWGGAYDRVPGVTPQDGYRADAPMRFFESEIGWVQPLSSPTAPEGGVHTVPGDHGATNPVIAHWFYREAGYLSTKWRFITLPLKPKKSARIT